MVIGAPKCGTTSLHGYIANHPQVQPPALKELCYFSRFKKYLQKYRVSAASSWQLYVDAFAGVMPKRTARMRRPERGGPSGRRLQGISAATAPGAPKCEAAGRKSFEACPFYLGEIQASGALHAVFPDIRLVAILRNPRERTVSAFNDYVRMGRIRGNSASAVGMEALVREKVGLVQRRERGLEDFDVRILTSGVYIHGLRHWGREWPTEQLLVLQSEDLFADTATTMRRVQAFLGLEQPFDTASLRRAHNRNTMASKSRPSRWVNETLDAFFAPYNEQLYEWAAARSIPLSRWSNASNSPSRS